MTREQEYAAFLELKAEQRRKRELNPPPAGTPAPWYTKRSWTEEDSP